MATRGGGVQREGGGWGGGGGTNGFGKHSEGKNIIGWGIEMRDGRMKSTRLPSIGVGRLNWDGVGEWDKPNATEWIGPTGKMHANRLALHYRVDLEEGLRVRIVGARFKSHHSMSVRFGQGGAGGIAVSAAARQCWYQFPIKRQILLGGYTCAIARDTGYG